MGPRFLITLLAAGFAGRQAAACAENKTGDPLVVACTAACEEKYVRALEDAAAELKTKIRIVTLKSAGELKSADAVLSPGGHDIDPKYFDRNLSPEGKRKAAELHAKFGNLTKDGVKKNDPALSARDEFESRLITEYLENDAYRDLPFLGVCYGMQMLAAVKGIPLTVDLQDQLGIPARRKVEDLIQLKGSALEKMVASTSLPGFKNHHQSVDMGYWTHNAKKFGDVNITGTSHEGRVAEVMELTSRPAMGIQFHAESTASDPQARLAPYKWLLEKACVKKSKARAAGLTR